MKRRFLTTGFFCAFCLSVVPLLRAQFTPEELAQRSALEEFLKKAQIMKSEDIGEGVTKPCRLYLKLEEKEESGCWKNPSGMQKGFYEGWQYEIAAYELDKLVGLNMIPPTVEREFKGRKGSFQYWITSTMNDLERMQKGIDIPQDKLDNWSKQKYLARAFDCLIANEDRTQQNIRYMEGWRTILIDHSRSFRSADEFRERLVLGRNGLLAQKLFRMLPRAFVTNLKALDFEKIKAVTGLYLKNHEIEAVLDRRDLLLAEIQDMIKEKGEENVLY
ncbi:MAG: hypothetical protein JXB23_01105 [Candidatus Aminicenantes bacterium]|nr:hypothetical protein [Candidatus Aminicenantes bacterium]